ncbi:tetratricopeptide repeat protein [candidate division KSB1 bacterium]|nr:tetratricopeptide repeat protein [candidate division KSB1 bacterium]
MKRLITIFTLIASMTLTTGCAYYNTFFNTKKFFDEAEKQREDDEKREATKNRNISDQQTREQQQQQHSMVSSSAKQKYTKAIEKASRLLEFYPNSKYVDDALLILGKSFYYRDESHKAKRKFEELINNFPQSEYVPEARLWLGKVHIELRDYKTAEENFRDILNGESKREIRDEAQFLLGGLYLHKQDYFSAANEFKIAAQNAEDKTLRCEAYYQLGECEFELKDFKAAADAYEKSKKYSQSIETEYRAQFNAGLAYKKLGQYDTAINIFTDLLGDFNNEDNWPDCKLEIADCLYKQGDIDNAIAWYISIPEEHEKANDAKARAYYNLGYIFQFDKADFEEAKKYYEEASKLVGRTEFGDMTKARLKAIESVLTLQADIEEQLKRISQGDSLAAVAEEVEIQLKHHQMVDEMILDNMVVDSLWSMLEDTTQERLADSLEAERRFGENLFKDKQKIVKNYFLYDSLLVDSLMYEHQFLLTKAEQIIEAERNKANVKSGNVGTPEEELVKDRLMLAEIFLFDFGQPDSALAEYLDVIKRDSLETNIAKSLYSIGYIYEKSHRDTVKADSVYDELLTRFPKSSYADRVRQKLSIPIKTEADEKAHEVFIDAEKAYMDSARYADALAKYEEIVEHYPESPYATKSLYAMGWIYEKKLSENDKALETYRQLIEKYPETNFAKNVKKKVDEVDRKANEKDTDVAGSDTTLMADTSINGESGEASKQEYEINDLIQMDDTALREYLIREMEKDNPRLHNPRRIIGN